MSVLRILFAISLLFAVSCNSKPERPEPVLPANYQAPATTAPAAAAPATPAAPEPAQNASGVWHYTCSAGCDGGAGAAVACGGCGATLVHNSTYHN